ALAGWRLSFHGDAASRRAHARAGADGDSPMDVDLHSASRWYGSRDNAAFFAEGAIIEIARTEMRVPRSEDHLRALCLHFLRHGAVRPVRLCDIALMVEGDDAHRPYDWARVLRGSRSQVEQIGVAIRLA